MWFIIKPLQDQHPGMMRVCEAKFCTNFWSTEFLIRDEDHVIVVKLCDRHKAGQYIDLWTDRLTEHKDAKHLL